MYQLLLRGMDASLNFTQRTAALQVRRSLTRDDQSWVGEGLRRQKELLVDCRGGGEP